MMLSKNAVRVSAVDARRAHPMAAARPHQAKVVCNAATAWESWTPFMSKRGAALQKDSKESSFSTELAAAVKKAAQGHKPTYVAPAADTGASAQFRVTHVDKLPSNLPNDMHDRLELIGSLQIKNVLGMDKDAPLECASISYTTTDINAGLCVTGGVVQNGADRSAIIALVASETERQASWSRLEGLILHWSCSEKAGSPWVGPPAGWQSSSDKNVDAGGAWQCHFQKQMVQQDKHYVLVMQLPLKGVLKSGGMVFVLKATEGQNTRWLKDARKQTDFFLDLQKLPVIGK